MTKDIVYAVLGEDILLAGVSKKAISEFKNIVFSDKKVIFIGEEHIPLDYSWSLKHVKKSSIWRDAGSYLLIKNFETYGQVFEKAFSNEKIN